MTSYEEDSWSLNLLDYTAVLRDAVASEFDAIAEQFVSSAEVAAREQFGILRYRDADVDSRGEPTDGAVQHPIARRVAGRVERTDSRRKPEQKCGHRHPRCERLVKVDDVEGFVIQRTNRAEGSRRVGRQWRDRSVRCGGQTVPQWSDKWFGRRTVARPEHPHLVTHRAEFTGQTEHLHLHSAGQREAIWTEHPDAQHTPTVATIGYGAAMSRNDRLPAVSVVATPNKRGAILDLAEKLEGLGFPALACPSLGGTLGLCTSLAHRTNVIKFFTSIQPIYYNHPVESANTVAHIHEVSGGRFGFGIGVSHGPVVERLGVQTGKPLSDIRNYVAAMRKQEQFSGQLPPIYLATMRDKMLSLAGEIADGAIWANASLSNTPKQLARHTGEFADGFMLTNMIPTVIDDDIDAARAINRKTMRGYVILPNYRNYWREAGYAEEMDAIETLIADGRRDELPTAMSNRWLDDCTLSGPVDRVRDGLAAWYAAGVMPVAVMSSTSGGQAHAIGQLIDAYR